MIKLNPFLRDFFGTHGQIPTREATMPLFILGSMRSGTTWLVNKITQHPQLLKIGSELNEVWTEIGGADCLDHCNYKSEQDAKYEYALNMHSYFIGFIEESKSFKRYLMRIVNKINQQSGIVHYDWKNIIPVNKSPHLLNKIRYVNTLFPDSKYIFIIRDIYAHSSSMKIHFDEYFKNNGKLYVMKEDEKECWHRIKEYDTDIIKVNTYPDNFSLIPKMWVRLNYLALSELTTLTSDQYIIVKYEELMKNQEEYLLKIFEFLSLEDKHAKRVKNICKSKIKYHNTSTQGNPLEKWKTNLSEDEVELIKQEMKSEKYKKIISLLNDLKV